MADKEGIFSFSPNLRVLQRRLRAEELWEEVKSFEFRRKKEGSN